MTKHVALFALVCAAGCGSSGVMGGGDGGMQQPLTLTFGPIPVAAGVEKTQCITRRLGNPSSVHIGSIHNVLGPASHHMIVYKVADTVEQLTPVDCQPFKSTLDPTKGAPLMITQKHDELLQLPDTVGYTLDANQMLRLEVHYINATSADVMLNATTTMIPISDAQFKNEAGFLFVGDPDITLPPMMQTTLGPIFYQLPADLQGVNFFAITGHEHHLGTNVTVAATTGKTDPGTSVYNVTNWLWSEPETVFAKPAFQVPANGGFTFTCNWNNNTASQVKFGESANNEMCFFWAYYYPNKGARVCFHTDQAAGGLDICCPGSQYCGFIM